MGAQPGLPGAQTRGHAPAPPNPKESHRGKRRTAGHSAGVSRWHARRARGTHVSASARFPAFWTYTPADDVLVRAHEAATATRPVPTQELRKRYSSLIGSLQHAVTSRPEIAAAMGLLGSCMTCCTEELYELAMRVLVYLGRTARLGTAYSKHSDGSTKVVVRADANWSTTRSTTGYVIKLAGASVAHASRRQHCISMSTCEAELIALADAAIELLSLEPVLTKLGYEHKGEAYEVGTDNKAAYDLCHRFTSAQNSRHIDRKLFKMRELRGAGRVTVRYIPTDENEADLFTKILGRHAFEKHRKTVLNLSADNGVEQSRKLRAAAKTTVPKE